MIECPECAGSGSVWPYYVGDYVDSEVEAECPLCYGEGQIRQETMDGL